MSWSIGEIAEIEGSGIHSTAYGALDWGEPLLWFPTMSIALNFLVTVSSLPMSYGLIPAAALQRTF